jgi:hypothetical protein
LPDESAAVVPVPSSNVQCAAGDGTEGMLPIERSLRDSNGSTIQPAADLAFASRYLCQRMIRGVLLDGSTSEEFRLELGISGPSPDKLYKAQ